MNPFQEMVVWFVAHVCSPGMKLRSVVMLLSFPPVR